MARNFIYPPERELSLLHTLTNYQKIQNERNTKVLLARGTLSLQNVYPSLT